MSAEAPEPIAPTHVEPSQPTICDPVVDLYPSKRDVQALLSPGITSSEFQSKQTWKKTKHKDATEGENRDNDNGPVRS